MFLMKKKLKLLQHILKEINERLNFLLNANANYLTLSRESEHYQVVKLKESGWHLKSDHLTGVLYVLDEPSIGLHQRDNKLINALKD